MNSELAEGAPATQAHHVRASMPRQGLFAGHDWRISPAPFQLGEKLASELEKMGRLFLQFYRAVNLLYRKSAEGKIAPWVAEALDRGKPRELVELQRSAVFKNQVPRVIRPDLLLVDDDVGLTELDSVPGGIGLTAWLNQTYSKLGYPVLGGAEGMLSGFTSIFGNAPAVHIVVSEEAATYRPEMEWVASQTPDGRLAVRDANFTEFRQGDSVYRFFELFDVPNVPNAETILRQALEQRISLTPPPKSFFEEKMLFALLWNANLIQFWRQELGESFFRRMLKLTPYTWLVDPSPLPPHAAIPELNITDWRQLGAMSQRERYLVLKVSGFSPHAWGSRGVFVGSDLSHSDWAGAIERALSQFDTSPFVLQRYRKTAVVNTSWYDFQREQTVPMPGRVRLCPYYFVTGEAEAARANLGGILATICPADKKIIHGMTEAIFAPCIA